MCYSRSIRSTVNVSVTPTAAAAPPPAAPMVLWKTLAYVPTTATTAAAKLATQQPTDRCDTPDLSNSFTCLPLPDERLIQMCSLFSVNKHSYGFFTISGNTGNFMVCLLFGYRVSITSQTPSHNQTVPIYNCFSCLQSCCTYLKVISASHKTWRRCVTQPWSDLFACCSSADQSKPHTFDHRSPTELHSLSVVLLYLTGCRYTAAQCSVPPLPESDPQDVERHGSEADRIFLHGGRYQQHPNPQPWWGPPPFPPHFYRVLTRLSAHKHTFIWTAVHALRQDGTAVNSAWLKADW